MVIAEEKRILIDTYPEAKQEDLPMFAENRVHQRTSGNPYPNKVVLEAQRDVREKREYTLLTLENEFIEIGILPELGGKIWYANDKKNGYGFFYKNNVVKPALIDGIETYNGHPGHDSRNNIAILWAEQFGLKQISGTDFHHEYHFPTGGIVTESPVCTNEELAKVLASGEYEALNAGTRPVNALK